MDLLKRTKEITSCKCCNKNKLNRSMQIIAALLTRQGYKITSAYRCPDWNRQIGGSSRSQHMEGLALDIFFANYHEQQDFLSLYHEMLRPDMIIPYTWGLHLDWRKGITFQKRFPQFTMDFIKNNLQTL